MEQRKPKVYLAVILPVVVLGGVFCIAQLVSFYAARKGIPVSAIPNTAGLLIAIPAAFLWLPLGLPLSNVIIGVVPPLRRVAQQYSAATASPGFVKAQFQLFMFLLATGCVCIPIILYGFTR
jgi:hypothetical protein